MRFPHSPLASMVLVAFASVAMTAAAAPAAAPLANAVADAAKQPEPRTGLGPRVSSQEVQAAAARLRSDPDLGGEHKVRTLRWVRSGAPDPPQKPPAWIQGLFEYLGQTGRLLLWVAGSIMAAIAVIWVYRTFTARTPAPAKVAPPTLARVGSLDIRPESLPENIGEAALALADQGKTREALSLLYRGALSRAVHRFGVPIGESYTEGEALHAVGVVLDAPRVSYFSDLVGMRRRAVYAGYPTAAGSVGHLCRRFATLDAVR